MINIISSVLIAFGFFFFFAATIGILRFPDFYSRMHAAGKGDTLSSLLVMAGLALFNLHELNVSAVLTSLKIMFICVFIFMASPTATHNIIEAGYNSGVKPWVKDSKKEEGEKKE